MNITDFHKVLFSAEDINQEIIDIKFKYIKSKNMEYRTPSNWDKYYKYKIYSVKIIGLNNSKKEIAQVGLDPFEEDDEKLGYVFGVIVKKEYRGYNIGSKIMNECEKYAKSINIQKLLLRPANDRVMKFYEKLGYKFSHVDVDGKVMFKLI